MVVFLLERKIKDFTNVEKNKIERRIRLLGRNI